ncbi:protein of unknown function DUF1540 [Desulfotomaculum nigrificans CO-1-SRB]|uniref:DUF1540 domain-containing protein n=1 Tax=Desulfotomaculum nigrificans (strain DSM 14880 / VKM B-2319 / CO-1-SRB) TaxID=868595 RepID=F6B7G1_DESCC|nr:DUF1540 domain-containing protein [Desulfotomaculum nigrificans]AEF94515.1 protein of unknown function DUF1540 [Desulfotomaculum nigrificans CO-1-SRB]
MNQHIHCIVNDCHYWAQGNKCEANEILVATDQFSSQQPDRIDASMASQLTPAQAGNCMSTCCKSYVPKGSGKITADNITKMS